MQARSANNKSPQTHIARDKTVPALGTSAPPPDLIPNGLSQNGYACCCCCCCCCCCRRCHVCPRCFVDRVWFSFASGVSTAGATSTWVRFDVTSDSSSPSGFRVPNASAEEYGTGMVVEPMMGLIAFPGEGLKYPCRSTLGSSLSWPPGFFSY